MSFISTHQWPIVIAVCKQSTSCGRSASCPDKRFGTMHKHSPMKRLTLALGGG